MSELSPVRLVQGDALEKMRGMEAGSVVLITDPPYGVSLGEADQRGGKHGLARGAYVGYGDTYENFVGEIVPRINLALDLATRAAVFTGPHIQEQRKAAAIGGIYCPAGSGRHSWGFKTFLPILFYGKALNLNLGARPNVLNSNAVAEKNGHPCPKPLAWMEWLVELTTRPGDVVLDPFMGSGTTGVACVNTGRRFIGIEVNPEYFALAEENISDALIRLDRPHATLPRRTIKPTAETPLFAGLEVAP